MAGKDLRARYFPADGDNGGTPLLPGEKIMGSVMVYYPEGSDSMQVDYTFILNQDGKESVIIKTNRNRTKEQTQIDFGLTKKIAAEEYHLHTGKLIPKTRYWVDYGGGLHPLD